MLHDDASVDGITEERWHDDDYSVGCGSAGHKTFEALAAVFILIYPVGIPVCFLFLLWRDSLCDEQRKQSMHMQGNASAFDFLRTRTTTTTSR
jgi:hypothetical protein